MMSANDSTGETRNWSVFSGLKFGFLLGLVFASGYFAARVSSPSKSSAPTESKVLSDSERLELAQAKYEAIQRKLKLRYHEELTSTPKDMAEQKPTNTNENERVKSPQLVHEKPSSDRMAKALVKVLGTSTPDSVNKAVIKELPTQTGSPYAVQVASLMDRKAAEEMTNRLVIKGYAARLLQAQLPDRGIVYRIRIHGFNNKDEADKAREDISQRENLEAITVSQSES